VRPEVRRVRDCPYLLRARPPAPSWFRVIRFCRLSPGPCLHHPNRRLSACSRYHRHMSRAIHMPERRGPY
jgi:hypothetical protein